MDSDCICFNKDVTFIGMFEIPNIGNYAGKLLYKVNGMLEFHIYTNTMNMPQNVNQIFANLVTDDEKIYFATFNGCRLNLMHFSSVGNGFIGYFDNVLFSKTRHFGNPEDNLTKANIYINNWAEFCFPQGFKTHAEYKPLMKEFKLKNKMIVSFNQDIKGLWLSQTNIFNDLFVNTGLSDNQITTLETELENILSPHRDNIFIKKPEKHEWFIKLDRIPQKYGIDIVSYYINALMKCLTYNFGTEIDKIEIISSDPFNNGIIPIKFDYLYYRSLIFNNRKGYNYNRDVFNVNTFDEKEWKTILNKLFSKSKIIEPFFDILIQNHKESAISEYHIERYIDCIQAIGNNKNYGSIKYEKVLKDFVKNLDPDLKKTLLFEFKSALKVVKVVNKKRKRNWGLVGLKLSQLRAMTTHFNETSKRINMERYLEIYFILELITIDYIFELLGINSNKRLLYKEKYCKIIR